MDPRLSNLTYHEKQNNETRIMKYEKQQQQQQRQQQKPVIEIKSFCLYFH